VVGIGFVADQSGYTSPIAVADQPQRFAWNAKPNLDFRANRNELDEAAQRVNQEIAALVTAVEADLVAKET
jgi:hypothetical protein